MSNSSSAHTNATSNTKKITVEHFLASAIAELDTAVDNNSRPNNSKSKDSTTLLLLVSKDQQ